MNKEELYHSVFEKLNSQKVDDEGVKRNCNNVDSEWSNEDSSDP
jgi:hypothetical protein